MSVIPVPTGPTNRELVDGAYTALGLSDSMFGRTAEEYASGVAQLRAMMAEHPFDKLGFDTLGGEIENPSGIADKWRTAVSYALAIRIGASIGAVLKPGAQAVHNRAYSALCAAMATISPAQHFPGSPRGSGHRVDGPAFFAEGE